MAATDRAAITTQSPHASAFEAPSARATAVAIEPIPIEPASSGMSRRLRLRMSNHSSSATRGAATSSGSQKLEVAARVEYATKHGQHCQLDRGHLRCQSGSWQPPAPEAINQNKLQRSAGNECHHRRQGQRETGPRPGHQQTQHCRLRGEAPAAVFGGECNGSHRDRTRVRGRLGLGVDCAHGVSPEPLERRLPAWG